VGNTNGNSGGYDLDDPKIWIVIDPTGENHGGLPTFLWGIEGQEGGAPGGMATRRQLAEKGLRKNGQEPAAQVMFKARGRRRAYLFLIAKAAPRRPWTPAKQEAVEKAARARRRCVECKRTDLDYIPQQVGPAWGRCNDCMGYPPRPEAIDDAQ
jgi:hypothetical protein